MWSFIFGLAGGVVGWWVTHWIGAPIVEFEKTRREVREKLNFYRHLAKDWKVDEIARGEDTLRQMASRVEAAAVTPLVFVRWYFRLRKWDLVAAHSCLNGLANVQATSRDERKVLLHRLERALDFPTSDDPERIERIQARQEARGE